MHPLIENFKSDIRRNTLKRSEQTLANSTNIALASYVLESTVDPLVAQVAGIRPVDTNLFVFAASKEICAELHISSASENPTPLEQLEALIPLLDFQPDYKPAPTDYGKIASIFYTVAQDYAAAAIYYQRAFDALPPDQLQQSPVSRYLTDQLSMSYGMSGNITRSRSINEAAVAKDPDYPLYYYNLACADAEQGDATSAHQHLEQAFQRRANTLPGEHLPDPAKDDSILKLKKNKTFWNFVESLPKN